MKQKTNDQMRDAMFAMFDDAFDRGVLDTDKLKGTHDLYALYQWSEERYRRIKRKMRVTIKYAHNLESQIITCLEDFDVRGPEIDIIRDGAELFQSSQKIQLQAEEIVKEWNSVADIFGEAHRMAMPLIDERLIERLQVDLYADVAFQGG